MIFYFTGAGVPLFSDVERVFQGSAKANTLFFVCPTASANAVSVCFGLPNASATQEYAMTLLTESGIPHCVDDDGNPYNVWRLAVPAAITQKFGTVRVQFFVRDGDGATLASATNAFTVEQGVVPSTPDYVDGIDDAIEKIGEINTKLNNVYTKTQADALYDEKIAKTDIVDTTGDSSSKVMNQAAVTSAINARVKANPALTGSEADLSALEVGGTKYKVPQGGTGTEVEANPALSGSEADLTAIKVGGTKYKVGSVKVNPTLSSSEQDLLGLQVGSTKYKVTKVKANPTTKVSDADLTGIQVDGTTYKVTKVNANPTLSSSEQDLLGLQVGSTKYKVTKVSANPATTISDTRLTGLTVGSTKYRVSKVIANPVVSSSDQDLLGLQVDNTKYKVTKVVANPSASATVSLTKLKVGDTVYSVPQSGSSSSSGIETVKADGKTLSVSDKSVDIPVVSDTKAGVISADMKNIAFNVFVDDALLG